MIGGTLVPGSVEDGDGGTVHNALADRLSHECVKWDALAVMRNGGGGAHLWTNVAPRACSHLAVHGEAHLL